MFLKSLAGLLLAGVVLAGDLPSGPQVGKKLTPFKVLAFSGPDAGKELELLKKDRGPTLLIFVQKITRPGLKFLRPVDKFVAELEEGKLHARIVWVSEDKDKAKEFLERAKNSLSLETPIVISLDGKDGPGAYGLNDQVAITVLIARDGKVEANFALIDPNANDAPKVIRALGKATGKKK
jgi:hypothetical protein